MKRKYEEGNDKKMEEEEEEEEGRGGEGGKVCLAFPDGIRI